MNIQNDKQDSGSGPAKLTMRDVIDALNDAEALAAMKQLEQLELSGGEVLFTEGDPGDSMYILLTGALGVRVRQQDGTRSVIDKLFPVETVGEMALISGRPRTAEVYAIVESGLMRMSRALFDELTADDEDAASAFYEAYAPRWQRLQLAKVLHNLFGELDTPALHDIQSRLEWRHLSNGDVLFNQDDIPDGMYIVVNGRLRALVPSANGDVGIISEIGTGETVGEYALLSDEKRAMTVIAVRETDVVRITPADFEHMVNQYTQLYRAIARIIIERQRSQLESRSKPLPECNIALMAGSPNLNPEEFAVELEAKLGEIRTTLYLTADKFDSMYGQTGAAQTPRGGAHDPAVVAWLAEQDRNNDHIIYVCDRTYSNWTRRCLSQADRILLVADTAADPKPGEVEQAAKSRATRLRLDMIMVHPAGTASPSGTTAWLQERDVRQIYHIRAQNSQDMARLARSLTGRAVALVLSGGGARGLAYLGVYRAMEELNIPIDYVGGTSIGALVAIAIAAGKSHQEVMALGKAMSTPDGWKDNTLPFTSLMTSRRVTDTIRKVCGDLQIEDSWLPYFCLSTNITTAETLIHRRGPAWRAVRASLSIPGVFAPVIEGDEVLVDGGVMNNFPVDVMAELSNSYRIIGATVSAKSSRKANYNYDTSLSGWKILNGRINPFAQKVRSPSITGTIMRTLDVNSLQKSRETEKLADLIIRPDVRQWGFMDYPAYQEIEQKGYEEAIGPLSKWLEDRAMG